MFGWLRKLGSSIFKLSETPGMYADGCVNGLVMPTSPESAMKLSTVFACVLLLSESVATLPCVLYRRIGANRREVAYGHRLYRILHDSPNYDLTSVEFWERCMADVCMRGDFFAEKTRIDGRIVSLNQLFPDLVDVMRDSTGAIRYFYADPIHGWREIAEENMFHVRGFGTTNDDTRGLSRIAYAATSLDIAKATDDVAAKTYKNSLRPSGILATDRALKPDQRKEEQEWMRKAVGGVQGAGKTLVLEGGYKYTPMSISPSDAQMLENRSIGAKHYGIIMESDIGVGFDTNKNTNKNRKVGNESRN